MCSPCVVITLLPSRSSRPQETLTTWRQVAPLWTTSIALLVFPAALQQWRMYGQAATRIGGNDRLLIWMMIVKSGTVFRYAYTTLDLHTGDNAWAKQNVITFDGVPSFNLWMGIVAKAFYKLHWEKIEIWWRCLRLLNQTCASMSLCSKETSLQFPEIKEFIWSFFPRMDSFFLAEMFKYLFLLFAELDDIPFDVEDYVFTTEAHLLPLSLSMAPHSSPAPSNRTVTKTIPL